MRYLALILLASLTLSSATRDRVYGDSWAIVIGINDYNDDKLSDLNYAVDDAEAVSQMIVERFGFKSENVQVLLDGDATRSNITSALEIMSGKTKKNDRVLFFFAGHGETKKNPAGGDAGYIIPVDGDKSRLYSTCIPMKDLDAISDMYSAKHMLFLIDACYSGLATMNTRGGLDTSVPGYIDKVTRDDSRVVITAGSKGEEAIEKAEWGNSAFTKNLINGLGDNFMADLDNDGAVTSQELALYLKKKVDDDTDSQQTPQQGRFSNGDGEFVFFNIGGTINIEAQETSSSDETDKLKQQMDRIEQLLLAQGGSNENKVDSKDPTKQSEQIKINLPGLNLQVGEDGVTIDTPDTDTAIAGSESSVESGSSSVHSQSYNRQLSRVANILNDFEDRIDEHIDTFKDDISEARSQSYLKEETLEDLLMNIIVLETSISNSVADNLAIAYKSGPAEGVLERNLKQWTGTMERETRKSINNIGNILLGSGAFKDAIDSDFETFESEIDDSFERLGDEIEYEFSDKNSEELSDISVQDLVDDLVGEFNNLEISSSDKKEGDRGFDFDLNPRFSRVTGIGVVSGGKWVSDEPLNLVFSGFFGAYSKYKEENQAILSAHRFWHIPRYDRTKDIYIYIGGRTYSNMIATYDSWLNDSGSESMLSFLLGQSTYDYLSVSGYSAGLTLNTSYGLATTMSVQYFDNSFTPLDNGTGYSVFNKSADKTANRFGVEDMTHNPLFATRMSGFVINQQQSMAGGSINKTFRYDPGTGGSASKELIEMAKEQGIDIASLVTHTDGPNEVYLIGESPSWGDTKRYPMALNDEGIWVAQVDMYPGKHLFSFEVDGERTVSGNGSGAIKKRTYKGREVYQFTSINWYLGTTTEKGTWESVTCESPAEASPSPMSQSSVCAEVQGSTQYTSVSGQFGLEIPVDLSSTMHIRWASSINYDSPIQKFPHLGGLGTVRGYDHKEFIYSDNMWLLSIEYNFILKGGAGDDKTTLFAFTDLGGSFEDNGQGGFRGYFDDMKQSIGLGYNIEGWRFYCARSLNEGSQFNFGLEIRADDFSNYIPHLLGFGLREVYE